MLRTEPLIWIILNGFHVSKRSSLKDLWQHTVLRSKNNISIYKYKPVFSVRAVPTRLPPHGPAGVLRVSGTSVKTEGTDFFLSGSVRQTICLKEFTYYKEELIRGTSLIFFFFIIMIRELWFRFQEFPEKTRPVGFKHPAFHCPDMSPSPSVPSSGLPRTSKPILFKSSYCELTSIFLFSPSAPVEHVKPGDIKVIAALGDSLTVCVLLLFHCDGNVLKYLWRTPAVTR